MFRHEPPHTLHVEYDNYWMMWAVVDERGIVWFYHATEAEAERTVGQLDCAKKPQ